VEGREYASLDEVLSDLHAIFDNCELYNESNSVISKEANRLRKVLNKLLSMLL